MRENRGHLGGRGAALSVQAVSIVQGTITGRDVLRHSLTILRFWGPGCYLRCLRAAVSRRPSTFLGVIYGAERSGP